MTVLCSNPLCGKTFPFTPPANGGMVTRSFGDRTPDKKSYPATCPHCKALNIVTKG